MSTQRIAFVDEATATLGDQPDTYLLAAVICAAHSVDDLAARMASLKPPSARKLHWRELPRRSGLREAAIAALNNLEIASVVVVRHDASNERMERRRRLCMERLVIELDARGVEQIVAESRGPADDRRDVEHFVAMASRGVEGSRIRISHEAGPANAALWAADVIAGAVTARLIEPSNTMLEPRKLTVIRISP